MTTRELTIGDKTSRFETGKLAKQAGGSVIVRYGDSVVLVTACRAANAARGHRLPAADGRLPRIHLRVGPHSRRLLQARRQAGRKGSPDEPRASTGRSGRCSRPAGATRRRSSRSCSRPTARTTPTCSRSPAPPRRSRCRRFRSRRRSPACASAWSTASTSINPTFEQRKESKLDLDRRRQQGRPRDGRSRREGSDRGAGRRGARSRRTPPSSRSSPRSTTSRKKAGKKKLTVAEEGNRPRLLPRGRREGPRAAHRGDAHPRQARELRAASTRCSRSSSRRFPKARSSGRPTPRRSSRS